MIHQYPEPGAHLLRFRGDVQRFLLQMPEEYAGGAWLRTNIGHAAQIRAEIIRSVQKELPPLGLDWFDIPMRSLGGGRFEVLVPLCEVGHFEAKCYFLPEKTSDPVWPQGSNTVLNVAPAHTCCGNLLYNAFVRQFGATKHKSLSERSTPVADISSLDKADYTVIPPSGKFRDLITELDFIFNTLGCRFLQLLPIHPTPTTYARMGRFGSPYAALSFTAVDPALAQFDPHATPLEQFIELVDAVHARHGKIILDVAINHTGWAAELHEEHPEWLSRDSDGRIEVPGAWGIQWEDLTKLDYRKKGLWVYMAEIFLTWCRRGVDGFRCDAGYMIPLDAWRFIVAMVREQYPDTIFLLEGLGGKISVTQDLLDPGNFNWAYSELFQNYDRAQIETYLPQAIQIAERKGVMIHFAETHDNPRLAAKSKTYARLRTCLCALFAPYGAFGFANGVEWFATEKINVHDVPSLNWGASDNQVDAIGRLAVLLKNHPAFHDRTDLSLVQTGDGNHVALCRRHRPSGKKLLVLANLDDSKEVLASWDRNVFDAQGPLFDLLTEQSVTIASSTPQPGCPLPPGGVMCLSTDSGDFRYMQPEPKYPKGLIPRIVQQQFRAKALDVFCYHKKAEDVADFNPDEAAKALYHDPGGYCRSLHPNTPEPGYVHWCWPRDARREVMIPAGYFLLVTADTNFRAGITEEEKTLAQEESLPSGNGDWFLLFRPLPVSTGISRRHLKISVFSTDKYQHENAPLMFLPRVESLRVSTLLGRRELLETPRIFLATNDRGGMLRAPLIWGQLTSRYDALLAANRSLKFPEDRWIMFTRCRAWIVFQGYSQELRFDCCHTFHVDMKGRGLWRFHVPTGQGEHVRLTLRAEMTSDENTVRLFFYRHPAEGRGQRLADDKPVRLIVRPDVENRNFHHATKAYLGPESDWHGAVTSLSDGFVFSPEPPCRLAVFFPGSRFTFEPEWQYMIYKSEDAERGFDPDSDLFSPGYFSIALHGNEPVALTARIVVETEQEHQEQKGDADFSEQQLYGEPASISIEHALRHALGQFVVKRGRLRSIIAGYPWFLDWGRDALIVSRGLIAAGRLSDARGVLRQFGQLEAGGTLPNMISGKMAANYDTSDAPLWFFVGCRDMMDAETSSRFIETRVGKRTIRDILFSIAAAYLEGTRNGIRMDPETGLVFSPGHFTWMDTNFPAGTPREGYPIEIQALWFHALSFLARIDPEEKKGPWQALSRKVQTSITDLYLLPDRKYLSDCLHAPAGKTALEAVADDYLRPNQLLAVTLGAVTGHEHCRSILDACQELLVPGAIRSLANRPVDRPLPIVHNGTGLNDPHNPYWGMYKGDEDTRRKPAYHNGTAWAWQMPSFCEAWVMTYGPGASVAAGSWLGSGVRLLSEGCLGQIPEILDGDAPHRQRGCDAQAWSVSELLRVWLLLQKQTG